MSEDKPRVDINVVQVVASALAAVSSAVLLSTVGVAGTLIGAAIGSVIATVGGAIYTYSLQASRQRVAAAAQVAAMARANLVRRTGAGAQDTRPLTLPTEAAAEAARPRWREALSSLSWKHLAVLTGGVFLAAMVAIVAFELVAGRPVSYYTGGTSKTSETRTTLGGSTGNRPKDKPTDTSSSPSSTATSTPSDTATQDPSTDSSPEVTPAASPTEASPTEEPTVEATPSPSASAVPSEPAPPSPSADAP